ncbi:hypothetical protein EBT31_19345, partial [bacterium]|nr:hypothetical protein [bacterium]
MFAQFDAVVADIDEQIDLFFDGKININYLVRAYDQQPNLRVQEMLQKLYEQLGIPREKIFPIMDWVDENSEEMGSGAEAFYYSGLLPPRKIKNGPLYTL